MSHPLDITAQAQKDIAFHRQSGNRAVLKKLLVLLEELAEHPFAGTGKPEPLKHGLAGCWSRRITKEHRLVYELIDDKVVVHSAKGHYQ